MFKLLVSLLISFLLSSTQIIQAQLYSIQANFGIISPMSSSDGVSTSVQFNYHQNDKIYFYLSAGLSHWDKNYLQIRVDWSEYQKKNDFDSYTGDTFIFLPVHAGMNIKFNTTKWFSSFVNFELGYSYLKYNSYSEFVQVKLENGAVTDVYPDPQSKIKSSENLFDAGIGGGLSIPMYRCLSFIAAYKLNSHINSSYDGIFSARALYSTFLMGALFNI